MISHVCKLLLILPFFGLAQTSLYPKDIETSMVLPPLEKHFENVLLNDIQSLESENTLKLPTSKNWSLITKNDDLSYGLDLNHQKRVLFDITPLINFDPDLHPAFYKIKEDRDN